MFATKIGRISSMISWRWASDRIIWFALFTCLVYRVRGGSAPPCASASVGILIEGIEILYELPSLVTRQAGDHLPSDGLPAVEVCQVTDGALGLVGSHSGHLLCLFVGLVYSIWGRPPLCQCLRWRVRLYIQR